MYRLITTKCSSCRVPQDAIIFIQKSNNPKACMLFTKAVYNNTLDNNGSNIWALGLNFGYDRSKIAKLTIW